jgi:hypothetical protein
MSDNKKNRFSFKMPVDEGEIIDWVAKSSIEFQFDVMSQHIEFTHEAIEQEKKQLKVKVRKAMKTMDICDENEKNAIYLTLLNGGSSSWGHRYSAVNSFSQIQYHSEFLVIYSYFEHILNQLCYEVQKKSNFKLFLKDIHGQGIERARTYLVKLAGVEKLFTTDKWQRAKFLSKIRNEIMHNNSVIENKPEERKSLSAKLKNEEYIEVGRSSLFSYKNELEIMLSYEFLQQSIIELKQFLLEICDYPLYIKVKIEE